MKRTAKLDNVAAHRSKSLGDIGEGPTERFLFMLKRTKSGLS